MQASNYKLSWDTDIICRTPAFSPDDLITNKFDELKVMIKESSPAFYQVICNLNQAELHNHGNKINFTLWKYFNRARFRATPFGLFSGVSVLPNNLRDGVILSDHFAISSFIDWQAIDANSQNPSLILENTTEFLLNSTIYKVGNQYRYIFFDNRRFEIALISDFPELDMIVSFCREKQTKSALAEQLANQMHLDKPSIKQLLTQLISLQVLIPDSTPNITGVDFFSRKKSYQLNNLELPYLITERKLINGGYDNPFQKNLSELINVLNHHLPKSVDTNLQAFIKSLKRKFESRFVPLALALDPETGVGYANLETNQLDDDVLALADRFRHRQTKQSPNINFNPFTKYLLNESMQGGVIQLEYLKNDEIATPMLLPNTFSVILRHSQSLVIIEHIGGATANALIGRFSLGIAAFENMGRRLAAIEQDANPDVMFFDVAYQAERHIDNVNRRKALYNYELPILTWSCSDSPLYLDDILVGIVDNEIMLFSKRYRKRMIPRIPSAYNYHRSDLPLFRFLCDLQHQNIRSKLSFNLSEILPGLTHYSRVAYKNLVISPESWLMPSDLVKNLGIVNLDAKFRVKQWLQQINLTTGFNVGEGDQTLTLFPDNDVDLLNLVTYCRKNVNRPIYVSEAFPSNGEIVCNESGKPLAAQLILNCIHGQRVYNRLDENMREIKYYNHYAFIAPGNEWLYFAIYTHPNRFNPLLKQSFSLLLKRHRKLISKWYFVRYDDNGPHLRLRILLNNSKDTFRIMEDLQMMLAEEISTGIIADIQIKSYLPEIARYGKNRFEQVEDFFYRDSQWILTLLHRNFSPEQTHQITLLSLSELISSAFQDIDEKLFFINYMAQSYSKEFSMGQDDFKQINRQAEQLDNARKKFAEHITTKSFGRLRSIFLYLLHNTTDYGDKRQLAADLLHMHINRLFSSDQRAHEAILYQQLFRLMKKQQFATHLKVFGALPGNVHLSPHHN